jgi:A nuclease family of the HNH/ENDO VII superfamily with conserved AHH
VLGGPLGWGANVVRGLLLGGSVLGTATAAYEFPQLQVMDLAAKAGAAGGEKLTSQTPEEARMNLAMGYANLALAGLDLGLTPGLIGKVAKIPGAVKSAANLTRKQSQVLVNSVARHSGTLTDAALEKLLQGVRTADANTTVIIVNGDGTLTKLSPLEGVTQKLETTTAARASGKAKKPPKAFDAYANATRLKPFVGTKVDPNNLPPGYLYGKVPLENGKFREVIYMAKSDGTKVPLKLDVKGFIKMADEGEYRIVNSDVYTKNIQTIPGKSGKLLGKTSQIHHLIPDNVIREQKIFQEALKRGIYNPDRASNLIEMANKSVTDEAFNALRATNPNAQIPDIRHYSSHAKYDVFVEDLIDKGINGRDIRQLSDSEINQIINRVEVNLKEGFLNKNEKIRQKLPINEDGRLVQIESRSKEEIA